MHVFLHVCAQLRALVSAGGSHAYSAGQLGKRPPAARAARWRCAGCTSTLTPVAPHTAAHRHHCAVTACAPCAVRCLPGAPARPAGGHPPWQLHPPQPPAAQAQQQEQQQRAALHRGPGALRPARKLLGGISSLAPRYDPIGGCARGRFQCFVAPCDVMNCRSNTVCLEDPCRPCAAECVPIAAQWGGGAAPGSARSVGGAGGSGSGGLKGSGSSSSSSSSGGGGGGGGGSRGGTRGSDARAPPSSPPSPAGATGGSSGRPGPLPALPLGTGGGLPRARDAARPPGGVLGAPSTLFPPTLGPPLSGGGASGELGGAGGLADAGLRR
jgi:hypothetical protein